MASIPKIEHTGKPHMQFATFKRKNEKEDLNFILCYHCGTWFYI